MEATWEYRENHGTITKVPWKQWKRMHHLGSAIKAPWKHLEAMKAHTLRKYDELCMEAPRNSHASTMESPWKFHGNTIKGPLQHHGSNGSAYTTMQPP